MQECLVQRQTVTLKARSGRGANVRIREVTWKGLRCRVVIDGPAGDLQLDLRTHAGNANTSVVMARKPLSGEGVASVIVEDEDLTGHETVVTILDSDGSLLAQQTTVIGGTGA